MTVTELGGPKGMDILVKAINEVSFRPNIVFCSLSDVRYGDGGLSITDSFGQVAHAAQCSGLGVGNQNARGLQRDVAIVNILL